jgi:hypothetical protein
MGTSSPRFGVLWSLGLLTVAAGGLAYGCAASASAPEDSDSGIGRGHTDGSIESGDYDAGYGYGDDAGDPGADSAAGEAGRNDGGSGDAGSDAAVDPTCAATSTCLTSARDIGTVSGDTGSDVLTTKGTKSQWVKVRVTEDNSSFFGQQLKVKAELASPTGTNYDLHVYVDHAADTVSCTTVSSESKLGPGQIDQVIENWGEGTLGNGSLDDRTVSIYVENVSGLCGAPHEWTLTVSGNP